MSKTPVIVYITFLLSSGIHMLYSNLNVVQYPMFYVSDVFIMYDVTEYCLSYTVLVPVVQSGAMVTRSNLSQIYTQHCTDSRRTEFILEKYNRHQFLALTGEIWVVCCENLKKIDRVMAVPHCFNPFPVAFGALLLASLSYDVTSVLMQSSLRTSESDVLCLYLLLCLVVTNKCKYGEIKLCEKKKDCNCWCSS